MLSPREAQLLTPYLTALQNRTDGLTLEQKTNAIVELRWLDSLDKMSDGTRALLGMGANLTAAFAPGMKPTTKHYAGRHNQQNHGHRGSSISAGLTPKAPTKGRPTLNPIDGPDGTDWTSLGAGLQEMQREAVIAAFPHMGANGQDPVDVVARNVLEAFDNASAGQKAFGERWYKQAHNDAEEIKRDTDLSVEQSSAVIASLSPKLAWEPNARWAHYMAEQVHKNPRITGDVLGSQVTKNDETKTVGEWLADGGRSIGAGKNLSALSVKDQVAVLSLMGQIDGAKVGQGPRLTMEGNASERDYGTAPPLPRSMEAAINIMRAEPGKEMTTISENLGGHKTRSFYNAIVTAGETDSVTIDVHALDAAVLGYSSTVSGTKAKNVHGVDPATVLNGGLAVPERGSKGTYALFAEGFRQATRTVNRGRAARGESPLTVAQVQAIAWIATLPPQGR